VTQPDRPKPPPRQKFSLGRLLITSNAKSVLDDSDVKLAIRRHAAGDWGEALCEEDKARNEQALRDGSRLFSAYTGRDGTKFWIITESDRSATTVLLPEDY
jgi:hypothetical protein